MGAERTSRASLTAVHAGRPDSVRQRGLIISCRSNRTRLRRGTSGTVVEVQTCVYEHNFVPTAALTDNITYIVEFWLCCRGILYYYVTAKKK